MGMMTTREAALWCDGEMRGAETPILRVTTDSRQIQPGDLFVALRGEHFDGLQFAPAALAAGAAAVMVSGEAKAKLEPAVVVADTRIALGRLASGWRMRMPATVVAITGSSGKTTVKEMLAALLRAQTGDDAVLATVGNLNNDIGLPLTLLGVRQQHAFAVLEAGMNHAGELAWLSEIAQPDLVLVNNAGSAHIGLLGSAEAVARAKGELVEASPARAIVVLNADDRFYPLWCGMAGTRRIVSFGMNAQATVAGSWVATGAGGKLQVRLDQDTFELPLPLAGRHNAMNALAAIAAAYALGVESTAMRAGLARVHLPKGRLQLGHAAHGSRLIDDSYNANPESVRAAIDVLCGFSGTRILVLGDMGELGTYSDEAHHAIGQYAREAGIEAVYALGTASRATVAAFGDRGEHFSDAHALAQAVQARLDAQTTVLVKGSRFMGMERVVNLLEEND